jgi:hypothetical protein
MLSEGYDFLEFDMCDAVRPFDDVTSSGVRARAGVQFIPAVGAGMCYATAGA